MTYDSLRALAAVAAVLTISLVATAEGQTTDHLKCYKIKDLAVFKSATADLTPAQPEFPAENCSLKGKAAELCIPADKGNVVIEEGQIQDFPAQALADAQLCYKIKCPKVTIAPLEVSDQFGTRNVEKFKATKVCGPAFEQ